jgi:hypothetical protein
VNRRIPWRMVAGVACLILFLQPTKGIIRRQLSSGDLGESGLEILTTWTTTAASAWADALNGLSSVESQTTSAATRASLLTMAGVVFEKTPEVVPFQLGVSYPLLLENLVPRFFWADKPIVNVSNQFFQVEYGLTTRENLANVSIACGFEAEGYMNFGWTGVVVVGFFVGVAFGYYEKAFFSPSSSLASTAIGLCVLPGFLSIEGQLVVYLGGLLQIVFAAMIVFHDGKGRRTT